MKRQVLLTFDLEEFDLPLEFDCHLTEEEQLNISATGLKEVTGLLSKHNISATFFTTSYFAARNKEEIKNLAAAHEIASHSKYHSKFSESDLSESRLDLERLTGKKISGLRMPRFRKTDFSIIKDAGYTYDSSINPTFIPGRYNNLFSRKKFYIDRTTNLVEIPVSVSPVIRFPLFWLSFKNLPLSVYVNLCKQALWHDSYLNLCFHPWEFADLEHVNIPSYIKCPSGRQLSERFEKFLIELKKAAGFSTISDFLKSENIA